tara:strand:+ start:685 stop:1299 length:615 start_codon:yes stop_codon:yes gene_type:complete
LIFILVSSFEISSNQELTPALSEKLTKLYSNLKQDFNKCIDQEGLTGLKRLNTACNVGHLDSLQSILFQTRQEHISIYIDGFQPPGKAIKPRPAKYPGAEKRDLHAGNKTNREGFSFTKWMGYRGYVIVNFSIDEEGRTFNQALKESSFGSSGSSSGRFNDNAIAASKSLVFPPAKYLNKPISINNYSFKYRFEDGKENMLLWG